MRAVNMKKICLPLFACFAVFTAAMAADWDGKVQWPANYSTTATEIIWDGIFYLDHLIPYWEEPFIGPNNGFPVSTAVIDIAPGFRGKMFQASFSTLWNDITTPAYPIDKIRDLSSSIPSTAGAFLGSWKATYDDSYIYILVRFADPDGVTVVDKRNVFEVMISPYYCLDGYEGLAPGAPYARYHNLGGHYFEIGEHNIYRYLSISGNESGIYESGIKPSRFELEIKDFTSGTTFERIVGIPFAALDDLENNRPFNLDIWKKINGGEGIAFCVAYTEILPDGTYGDNRYLWSTHDNNIYYSNAAGAGYLRLFDTPYHRPINIINGSAPEDATHNQTVTIHANPPAETGKVFDKWESQDGITFADAYSPTTTFVMPDKAVTITATYKDENITVESGTSNPNNPWLYPNPAADYVTIQGVDDVDYFIVDITGAELSTGSNYSGEPIYVGDLLPGVYFIRIGNKTLPFVKK